VGKREKGEETRFKVSTIRDEIKQLHGISAFALNLIAQYILLSTSVICRHCN